MEPHRTRRVIVFGGYGTFGAHVASELARRNLTLTVAGRSRPKGEAAAARLGPPHRWVVADVQDPASCRAALDGHSVAIHCAGRFSPAHTTLLQACLDARCHYVDIADDRAYCAIVRGQGPRFAELGLTAAYGCSSLPSISGAIAQTAAAGAAAALRRVRCTLFIGNRNPKGPAAVEAALERLGRTIQAPQGRLRALRDRELVRLPPPFGARVALNFESPDYDLLPKLLEVQSVSVKVAFELPGSAALFAGLAAAAPRIGRRLVPWLVQLGSGVSRFGSSGGAVAAELWLADGSMRRAAVVALEHGQRMAALPAVYVAEKLCLTAECPAGALAGYELLGGPQLITKLVTDGYRRIRDW